MRTEHKPYALDTGEGTAYWFFGCDVEGLVLVVMHVQRGGEGKAEVHCGDESFNVGPGSFVMLPKGIPHWHRVDADAPLRSLVLTTGQFEQYVAACGEPAQRPELRPSGPPDLEQAEAAAERFHLEVLGPPPSSLAR